MNGRISLSFDAEEKKRLFFSFRAERRRCITCQTTERIGADGGVIAAKGKNSPKIRTSPRRFQSSAKIIRIEIGQIHGNVRDIRNDLKEKKGGGGGGGRRRTRGGDVR